MVRVFTDAKNQGKDFDWNYINDENNWRKQTEDDYNNATDSIITEQEQKNATYEQNGKNKDTQISQLTTDRDAAKASQAKAEGERDNLKTTVADRDKEIKNREDTITKRDDYIKTQEGIISEKDKTIAQLIKQLEGSDKLQALQVEVRK